MCLVYFVHFLFNYNIFLAVLQDVIKRDCLLVALVNQKMKKYKEVLYMEDGKKAISDKLYRLLDENYDIRLLCDCSEEEFYVEFKEALYDFSLIPTAAIIE